MTILEQVLKSFDISDDSLKIIKQAIGKEFELGLSDEDNATIKMLITYVRELSRGDETGSYLALDLGGTHFRVLLVTLTGGGKAKVTTAVHDIPQQLLITQNGQELFDYIALKLLEFVQQYKLKRRQISLGFTFSFPCKQYGLTQSVLVKWCKGFKVGGVIGTDVVKQLKDALKRQLSGLVEAYIDVVAVINDTTGTLVACANSNRNCRVGLIVGTGFNACYIEALERCEKWPANYTAPKEVIINCEWGAMGDNKNQRELDKFRNEFDVEVDKNSVNHLSQTYEKMVAGMYIGELLRLAIVKLYKAKTLFTNLPDKPYVENKTKPTSESSNITPERQGKSVSQQSLFSNPTSSPEGSISTSTTPRSPSVSSGVSATSSSYASSNTISCCTSSASSQQSSRDSSVSKSPARLNQAATSQPTQSTGHKLYVKDILDGKHISMLARDELNQSHEEATKMMQELNIKSYTKRDLDIIIHLSSKIITRSAHLVAAGISALLERIKRQQDPTVIGYDGSVIKYHPYFLRKLTEKCRQITPKQYRFQFMESSDGSGIGAAVVAAALHKERRPLYVLKPGKLYEMHFMRTHEKSTSSSTQLE